MLYTEISAATGSPTNWARAEAAKKAIAPWIEASGEEDDTYIVDFLADLMHAVGPLGSYIERAELHFVAEGSDGTND